MYDLACDAGVLNLVNYEFRAHPILSKLRDFVLSGMIGDVQHVHTSSFESTWNPRRGRKYKWSFDASRGGGWIRVQGSHSIDMFRFTYGEIVDATATYRTRVSERPDIDGVMRACTGEDGYTVILTGESGVSSTMDAMVTSTVDLPARSVVVGTAGVLEAIGASVHWVGGKIVLHNEDGVTELLHIEPWASTAVHDDMMMRPWAVLIARAVREQDPVFPLATFADGLAAARVMDKLTGPR
jgi:predicted dehydrogenase